MIYIGQPKLLTGGQTQRARHLPSPNLLGGTKPGSFLYVLYTPLGQAIYTPVSIANSPLERPGNADDGMMRSFNQSRCSGRLGGMADNQR